MQQRYKMARSHNFNPFKNSHLQKINMMIKQSQYNQNEGLETNVKRSVKQIVLIVDDQNNQSQGIMQRDKLKSESKDIEVIKEGYELHVLQDKDIGIETEIEIKNKETNRKQVVMFNQRQYLHKAFDQVYETRHLSKEITKTSLYNTILSNQTQPHPYKSKLIIYQSNVSETFPKLILGHNQNLSYADDDQESQNQSQSLLHCLYQKIQQNLDSDKSQIRLEIIGVEKENQLYDLLEGKWMQEDDMGIRACEQEEIKENGPKLVKVKRVTKHSANVITEHLTQAKVNSHQLLSKLIQKSQSIKNHIQYYNKFISNKKTQTPKFPQNFIAQIYRIYELSSMFNILHEHIILKINQFLPMSLNIGKDDGFFQRRMKEENTQRLQLLTMKLAKAIKESNQQNNNKRMRENDSQENNIRLPKRYQPKNNPNFRDTQLFLYLDRALNSSTDLTLVSQLGACDQISQEVRKLNFNISLKASCHDYFHTKHYIDNEQITRLVRQINVKFSPLTRLSVKESRPNTKSTNTIERQRQPNLQNSTEQYISQLQGRRMSSTTKTFSCKSNKRKRCLPIPSIETKSFFSHTVSSTQRNYFKSIQREQSKLKRVKNKLENYSTTYNNQEDSQALKTNQASRTNYSAKSNKIQVMRFVDERLGMPDGRRISNYKRNLVVKKFQRTQRTFIDTWDMS